MHPVRHERIRVNGVTLHVAIAGEGPPVILLHGFPEHWRSWRHQFGPLAAAGFQVWAPDLRGYNESDRPREREAYALPHLVDDVAGLVHATGAARAHIGGHDWGGMIAWAFASQHPELTERLLICNAPHPGLYVGTLRHPDQFLRSWYVPAFLVPGLAEWALSAGGFRALRRMFTHGPARRSAFTRTDVDAYVAAMATPGALTAALDYYRANAGLGKTRAGHWPIIRSQTLVVWGERDPALSLVQVERLPRLVPNLTVRRVPGAGHWVPNEAPEVVNRAFVEFLRQGPAEAGHYGGSR
jgi:pimeloyl-ACP methyl ester carboxylesterase